MDLLNANRDVLDAVVARLMDKESMSGDELREILRQTVAARMPSNLATISS